MTVRVTIGGLVFSNDATERMEGVTHKLTELEGWYATSYRTSIMERYDGDGAHVPGPSRRGPKVMTLKAVVHAAAFRSAVEAAWEAIAAVGGDGGDIPLRYEDTDAGTVRVMNVRVDGMIEPVPFAPGKANVAIPLVAYNPRKYAEFERASAPVVAGGIQPVGAGLRYALGGGLAPNYVTHTWTGGQYNSVSQERVSGVLVRSNLALNPAPANGASGGWSGVGGTGSNSIGPTDADLPAGRGYYRRRWTANMTTSGGGIYYAGSSGAGGVTAGTTYTVSAWVRSTRPGIIITAQVEWYDSSGALISRSPGTALTMLSGVFQRPSVTAVAPTGAVRATYTFYNTSTTVFWRSNDAMDMGALLVEAASSVGDYFDGNTAAVGAGLLDYGTLRSAAPAYARNLGKAAVFPVFRIQGGNLVGGFSITDQRSGGQIIFTGDLAENELIEIDMATKRVISNGQNDRTTELIVNDTMSIPPQDDRTYVFSALGYSATGTPSMVVAVTDGWW